MNIPFSFKIVLIGPESTGKTTLAQQLAHHYKTIWVEEYARMYIDRLERAYEEQDLLEIAKGQIALEEKAFSQNHSFVFLDTDLFVLKVWSLNAYQRCHPYILEQIEKRHYDMYFLCGVDVPWEYDEQREHPHMRQYFYDIYKKELKMAGKRFFELTGNKEERLEKAIKVISRWSASNI